MEVKNNLREANSAGGLGASSEPAEIGAPPKTGQVTNQQFNLEAVTADTTDLVNDLAVRLKRVSHPSSPSDGVKGGIGAGKEKPLVSMAADFEKIYNQAVANRDALRNILNRIDL